jgi:hypothetical protein
MKRLALAGLALAAGIALAMPGSGCGEPLGCKFFCQREAECCTAQFGCDPDKADIPTCTEACEALAAKDEAYAQAIEDQAACYDGANCAEVNGSCSAMP